MARLRVPTVACIIGEGGSGGAIALALADRVLMQENAVYSVISPEGCAMILWRDVTAAKKAAAAFKPDAAHCLELGVVDEEAVVPWQRGLQVGTSFGLGGLIPTVPVLLGLPYLQWWAYGLTALTAWEGLYEQLNVREGRSLLVINSAGGDDNLTYNNPIAGSLLTFTPGATVMSRWLASPP